MCLKEISQIISLFFFDLTDPLSPKFKLRVIHSRQNNIASYQNCVRYHKLLSAFKSFLLIGVIKLIISLWNSHSIQNMLKALDDMSARKDYGIISLWCCKTKISKNLLKRTFSRVLKLEGKNPENLFLGILF